MPSLRPRVVLLAVLLTGELALLTGEQIRRNHGRLGHRRLGCWSSSTNGTDDCLDRLRRDDNEPEPKRLISDWGWEAQCDEPRRPTVCKHKSLASHVVPLDLVAAVLFFVTAALALSAGIGGGGIFVPALALLLRFPPHVATALSQSLIFGGSVGALAVNALARHPHDESRPLIDIGVASFLAPAEMAGALLGVLLNQALPAPVILLAMTVLLTLTANSTIRKGLKLWAAERAESRRWGGLSLSVPSVRRARGGVGGETACAECGLLMSDGTDASSIEQQALPKAAEAAEALERVVQPGEADSQHGESGGAERTFAMETGPRSVRACVVQLARRSHGALASLFEGGAPGAISTHGDVAMLGGVWVGLIALLALRGGKGAPSAIGVTTCSISYWSLTVGSFVLLLLFSVSAGRRLVCRGSAGGQPHPTDMLWGPSLAATALTQTILAGVVAGLMGVGGGIVLGPLMLQMGMAPQV